MALASLQGQRSGSRFRSDDPLLVDDDRAMDASGAKEIEASDFFDFIENTFMERGDRRDIPAMNVNTIGEVPDSSWFQNRIGVRPMTADEVGRGPDRVASLSLDGWSVVAGKSEGLQQGFRMADPDGHLYQIEFDPPSNPEMATGAEMIGTAFYHAFGYHVVDVYLVEIDPARLVVSEKATIRDRETGKRRRYTRRDVDEVLKQSARLSNGRYRALASRFADGAPLGSFKYYGTRPDDPNDVFPHEHRRELRGNRVFAAWLNHDDSRGLNSLDMLEDAGGRKYVKHYMFDFGSIMGSGTSRAQTERAGNEYIFEWGPALATMASFGLYFRPWLLTDYPVVPASVGRFESRAFEPETWKPEYENTAFVLMQPQDAFWAARIVAQFTPDLVRAIVMRGRYSDPRAVDYLVKTLVERREKVLRRWLTAVNPIVDVALSIDGALAFSNAVERAGLEPEAARYRLQWFVFDNAAAVHTPEGAATEVPTASARAPGTLLASDSMIGVEIATLHAAHPTWTRPVRAYFRRSSTGWTTVGLER